MRIYSAFLMIITAISISLTASIDLANAEKKKKRTIGSSGCTAQQIKAHSSKCSSYAGLVCEGNTLSCCNVFEDELGLPEGFCIVVKEGVGSRPATGRANPGKVIQDLSSP